MKISNFNKILIVSLSEKFSSEVARSISHNLNMMFCDSKELLEYELLDKKAIQEKCSPHYLKELERKVLKDIASYENVCVSISYENFIREVKLFKINSIVVFVNLPKSYIKNQKDVINVIAYEDRTEKLKKLATLTIKIKKYDAKFVAERIITELGGKL